MSNRAADSQSAPPPLSPDARRFWRDMPSERKGAIIYHLLNLVAAKGDFPPKEDMFPGWKTIIARKRSDTERRSADS